MPSTTVRRRIPADPTSVALLLADPAAVELWPGLTRHHGTQADATDLLPVAVGSAAGAIRVLPPRRTPTAYVLRFDFDAQSELHVEGRLELRADQGVPVTTESVLELRADRDLHADASEFLRKLADKAAERAAAG